MNPSILFFLFLFALAGCVDQVQQPENAESPEIVYHSAGWEGAPFSEAVQVGNMLYLAGQLGTNSELELVEGGVQAETRQTMENIKATVERLGSSMDNVIKCTVFMADMSEWQAMNEVYVTYFTNLPARSAMGGVNLALGASLEIECIAIIK